MKTTIGGERLGSGNKESVSLKTYNRSTQDLSYTWRSSMSAGTLVPFMKKLALPSDSWDIDLNCDVVTLPTIGPLFGSYKVQLDVFSVPMRLFNAKLHMNLLGVGMDMSAIYLPKMEILTNNHANYVHSYADNEQVNPSSLLKYLGISGLGNISGVTNPAIRYFNAVPLLSYWAIYKNYYANKQEEIGYFVHTDDTLVRASMTPKSAILYDSGDLILGSRFDIGAAGAIAVGDYIEIYYPDGATEPDPAEVRAYVTSNVMIDSFCNVFEWNDITKVLKATCNVAKASFYIRDTWSIALYPEDAGVRLQQFPLSNIDDMRESILQYAGASAFVIDSTSDYPYSASMQSSGLDENLKYSCCFSQEGLGLKTYQSDLFNNWISTEWIDGTNGVNEVTAVSTAGDTFNIDALNLAMKVYVMLNRIAISGGSYDDWLDAVYTTERRKGVESPVYHGSLIKELGFEEVISTADTDASGGEQPLGTLAGRGRLTQKNKGGKIKIKIDEPSYIIGLASLTPRIDYSQGNDWDMDLETYDDFHKPALDAIGFQDLLTQRMLWSDSTCASATGAMTHNSLGKQPAWIEYMTDVDKVFGNFADTNKDMFMVLNRRYESDEAGGLVDGTTYIDPSKFNHIFAQTDLSSQNFWVQISNKCFVRRKMSAKVIPNL